MDIPSPIDKSREQTLPRGGTKGLSVPLSSGAARILKKGSTEPQMFASSSSDNISENENVLSNNPPPEIEAEQGKSKRKRLKKQVTTKPGSNPSSSTKSSNPVKKINRKRLVRPQT